VSEDFITTLDGRLTLVLADESADTTVRNKNGNGQGDLMRAFEKLPIAQAECGNPKHLDAIYLSHYAGTDYVRWHGRASDGRFYPIGRIMEIVDEAEYAKKARARDIAALVRQLREVAGDDEHRYSRAGRLCNEAADALVAAFLNAAVSARESGAASRSAPSHRGHAAEDDHPVTAQKQKDSP
jgi:hypothetical protein